MKKHYLIALSLLMCGGAVTAQPRSASAPQKLLQAPTGLMAPVWSPKGDKIAVTTDNFAGIIVANADGSDMRIVTNDAGAGYKMTWNADGNQIVGRTNITEGARMMHEIKSYDVTTGESRILVAKSRTTAAPTLKAAGLSRTANGVYDIMTSDPANAAKSIGALNGFKDKTIINPALSPDGTQVAFQIPGNGMWIINADGSDLRSLGKGSHPAWLPDGKTLVYTVVTDNGSQFTGSTLYAMDLASGKAVILTQQSDMIPLTPAVSPDGKKVAFENAIDASIYVVTLKY